MGGTMMTLVAAAVLIAAGIALAVQVPINASLSRSLSGDLPAATVSFGVGFLVLVIVSALSGQAGAFLHLAEVPRWQLIGGAFGAFYVWAAIWGVQVLGVFSTLAAVILGQVIGALAVDATGAFGVMVREITPIRLIAAGLVTGGLLLSRW